MHRSQRLMHPVFLVDSPHSSGRDDFGHPTRGLVSHLTRDCIPRGGAPCRMFREWSAAPCAPTYGNAVVYHRRGGNMPVQGYTGTVVPSYTGLYPQTHPPEQDARVLPKGEQRLVRYLNPTPPRTAHCTTSTATNCTRGQRISHPRPSRPSARGRLGTTWLACLARCALSPLIFLLRRVQGAGCRVEGVGRRV